MKIKIEDLEREFFELIDSTNDFSKIDNVENLILPEVILRFANNGVEYDFMGSATFEIDYDYITNELFESYTELINYYDNDMFKLYCDIGEDEIEKHHNSVMNYNPNNVFYSSPNYGFKWKNIYLSIKPDRHLINYKIYKRKEKLNELKL